MIVDSGGKSGSILQTFWDGIGHRIEGDNLNVVGQGIEASDNKHEIAIAQSKSKIYQENGPDLIIQFQNHCLILHVCLPY